MERNKAVGIWLFIGVVMIFFQIVIGGVTRLTGSGLSITKWEIVTGTIPPLSEDSWQKEFEHYKATPQYHKINKGMSLGDFKFIYFWEYFHRLWARSMGFVFLFPLLYFLWKKKIRQALKPHLAGVFGLAALVASFGWIMVASGLVERPWVNAYKLSIHLSLGILLYAYVLYLAYSETFAHKRTASTSMHSWAFTLTGVLALQIFFGGLMSGMKAGLFFPTWPDMNGAIIPLELMDLSKFSISAFTHYDSNIYAVAFVQFFHRFLAYAIIILAFIFWKKIKDSKIAAIQNAKNILVFTVLLQVTLGIITVVMCKGQIPVFWGVAHQAGAILLLSVLLYILYCTRPVKS